MSKISKTCSKCDETYYVDNQEDLSTYFHYLDKKQLKFRNECKKCRNKKLSTANKKQSKKDKSGIVFEDGLYQKKCGKCKQVFKAETRDGLNNYFHYRNKSEDILENRCKQCKRISNKEYIQDAEKKAKKIEASKKWRMSNKGKVKGYNELSKKLLDTYKALNNISMLSITELEFFKKELSNKLDEINLEIDNRNKKNL